MFLTTFESVSAVSAYILGFQMIVFGLNGFLNFMKIPPPPPKMLQFLEAAESTRYLMPTTKSLELISGICLLYPNARGLGLLLLAPLIFNIVGLHLVFNFSKSWIILLQVLVPYLLTASNYLDVINNFLFDIFR